MFDLPSRLLGSVLFVVFSPLLQSAPPNVVIILTDNHGPWTLGCYGSREILTPNIDRLAAEGTLFERAFANNAVCSPTRATLLTGLMPSQHGVHRYLGAGGAQVGPGAYCTIAEFPTLPKIFKAAGYACGLSGKWHLGGNMEPQEGFSYWITKPHGHSPGFYDQEIIEAGDIRKEPGYLTDLWTEHAVDFIDQNSTHPFFLLLAYNGPYGLSNAMHEPIRNRFRDIYEANSEMPSFPRATPHPWLKSQHNNINNLQAMRKYAAEVSAIDDGVGTVMEKLRSSGLDDNTIVIFVADQGLAGGHSGFWGMGDHTRPLTAYDPMLSIPLIIWQPGTVRSGYRCHNVVANYDLFPSLLKLAGLEDQLANIPNLPGRDLTDLMNGQAENWDDVMYFEFENVRAIRTRQWKYIDRIHQEPDELFYLPDDPGELHNLIAEPDHRETQVALAKRLVAFFNRYSSPEWDLWHGGSSKSGLLTSRLFEEANPQAKLPVKEGRTSTP
ncbi:MAG: sulfatase-like hydrolase/transferase [Planctomycetales bacterium]|nr:sulfatase-like hydrolase/transferase [Planctomycetales bacterium]